MQSIFQLRSHTNRRQFQQEVTQVVTKGLLFIRGKTAPELSYWNSGLSSTKPIKGTVSPEKGVMEAEPNSDLDTPRVLIRIQTVMTEKGHKVEWTI